MDTNQNGKQTGEKDKSPGEKAGVSTQESAGKKKDLETTLAERVENKENLPVITEKKGPGEMFSEFMKRHQRDFEMVVPKHLSPERVMRMAIAACKRNPQLMKCWMPSVVGGCLEAAALGLEINTPLHHAYLVPIKNNKTMRTEAELWIGYEGYIELMYKHPKVVSIFFNVVYERDSFRYQYGKNEDIEHFECEEMERGEITHFYAYAVLRDEGFRFVVVPKVEADRVRDEYSEAYKADRKESPWATDYVAMGCKTALRKLQKFVPKSAEGARATDADFKVIDPFDPQYMANAEAEIEAEAEKDKEENKAGDAKKNNWKKNMPME